MPTVSDIQEIEIIGKAELARRLNKSERTIERWMNDGNIPFIRIGPRSVVFNWFELVRHLERTQV
jgi:excisionase family DNA binding protein